jgi:hypothetical protein
MSWRVAIAALLVCTPAMARDNGQFSNVPPEIRAWFKSVKSHAGIPCCDISDGHRTDYDMRENKYWVPINGQWMVVPPEAVVEDSGNPTGDAVVWYTEFNGNVYIRCFVPGGGAWWYVGSSVYRAGKAGGKRQTDVKNSSGGRVARLLAHGSGACSGSLSVVVRSSLNNSMSPSLKLSETSDIPESNVAVLFAAWRFPERQARKANFSRRSTNK